MTTDEQRKQLHEMMERAKPRYFDRKGNPLQLMEWARMCEDPDYRMIKQEEIGRYFVSTMWIGLNMNHFGSEMHIFETMIFCEENSKDELDGYQARYPTEEKAILGHIKACNMCHMQLKMGTMGRQEEGIVKDLLPGESGQLT